MSQRVRNNGKNDRNIFRCRTFMQPIRKKMASKAGESLPEVLASVLIISLGMTMFVSAFLSSGRMLEQGDEQMQAYYTGRNEAEAETTRAGKTNATGSSESFVVELQMQNGSKWNLASSSSGTGTQIGRYKIELYQGTIAGASNEADEDSVRRLLRYRLPVSGTH